MNATHVLLLLLGLAPLSVFAANSDLALCRDMASDFIKLAYSKDKQGNLGDGRIQAEILADQVSQSIREGRQSIPSRVSNRAFYLRSLKLGEAEALEDVYALCASLMAGAGEGAESRVLRESSPEHETAAAKEAAWERYYRPRPACESPADWDVTVACGNERMKARDTFEARWRRGEFRAKTTGQ